jgi:hypothetical protein
LNVVHPSEHSIFIIYSNNITVNGLNVSTYGIHNADGIDLATSCDAFHIALGTDPILGPDHTNLGAVSCVVGSRRADLQR